MSVLASFFSFACALHDEIGPNFHDTLLFCVNKPKNTILNALVIEKIKNNYIFCSDDVAKLLFQSLQQ